MVIDILCSFYLAAILNKIYFLFCLLKPNEYLLAYRIGLVPAAGKLEKTTVWLSGFLIQFLLTCILLYNFTC